MKEKNSYEKADIYLNHVSYHGDRYRIRDVAIHHQGPKPVSLRTLAGEREVTDAQQQQLCAVSRAGVGARVEEKDHEILTEITFQCWLPLYDSRAFHVVMRSNLRLSASVPKGTDENIRRASDAGDCAGS